MKVEINRLYYWIVSYFVQHIKVGIKGKPLVIDGESCKEIKIEESTWCIEDGKAVVINVEKVLY